MSDYRCKSGLTHNNQVFKVGDVITANEIAEDLAQDLVKLGVLEPTDKTAVAETPALTTDTPAEPPVPAPAAPEAPATDAPLAPSDTSAATSSAESAPASDDPRDLTPQEQAEADVAQSAADNEALQTTPAVPATVGNETNSQPSQTEIDETLNNV